MKERVKLEGAEKFLEGCLEVGVQLVLFGHNHRPYRRAVVSKDKTKSLRAFCCPTTLEESKEGNGFYLFDFMDKDTISLDFYVSRPSTGGQMPFTRIAEESGLFKLSELSEEEMMTAHTVEWY